MSQNSADANPPSDPEKKLAVAASVATAIEPSPPRRRRFVRRLLLLMVSAVILLALLIGLAPRLASTNWGKRIVERRLGERIEGTARIGRLSLSWFGEQSASGVVIDDGKGRRILSVEDARSELTLWNALFGGALAAGKTSVRDLELHLYPAESQGGEALNDKTERSQQPPRQIPASRKTGSPSPAAALSIDLTIVRGSTLRGHSHSTNHTRWKRCDRKRVKVSVEGQ